MQSKYSQLQEVKSRGQGREASVMQSLREMNGGPSSLLAAPMSSASMAPSYHMMEHESVLRQKLERALKELDYTKKLLHNQHEDDMEQFMAVKKQLEKKVRKFFSFEQKRFFQTISLSVPPALTFICCHIHKYSLFSAWR